MKLPYEKPEAEITLFLPIERLASEETIGPNIDLEDNLISQVTGGVDWEWPEN